MPFDGSCRKTLALRVHPGDGGDDDDGDGDGDDDGDDDGDAISKVRKTSKEKYFQNLV